MLTAESQNTTLKPEIAVEPSESLRKKSGPKDLGEAEQRMRTAYEEALKSLHSGSDVKRSLGILNKAKAHMENLLTTNQ